MRLLFDQNLSFRLVRLLADLFPESAHVRELGLEQASDLTIFEYAQANDFAVVTLDSDFLTLAILQRPPPPIVWLRCGNQPTAIVERLIRTHALLIMALPNSGPPTCLEIRLPTGSQYSG